MGPKYVNKIRDNIIDVADDGSFRLNMDYFDYCTGLTMTNQKFAELFGGNARKPESELTQREMDLAASVQEVIEEVILKLSSDIRKQQAQKIYALVAWRLIVLQMVDFRKKILKTFGFNLLWRRRGAVGAALAAYHIHHGKKRRSLVQAIA